MMMIHSWNSTLWQNIIFKTIFTTQIIQVSFLGSIVLFILLDNPLLSLMNNLYPQQPMSSKTPMYAEVGIYLQHVQVLLRITWKKPKTCLFILYFRLFLFRRFKSLEEQNPWQRLVYQQSQNLQNNIVAQKQTTVPICLKLYYQIPAKKWSAYIFKSSFNKGNKPTSAISCRHKEEQRR